MVGDGAPSDGGIPNGARLIRFATAVLGDDAAEEHGQGSTHLILRLVGQNVEDTVDRFGG